ncbi:MAG TPA: hypothetical protein VNC11_04145, partial [Gemmatimonadaceae bacterium]|nr:hypothetical protein [Gemmatimonadaceae bacterium]
PSIEAARSQRHDGIVLAIHDGEDTKERGKSGGYEMSATVVPDPSREISAAYGVSVWPTVISIDESGLVDGIRHGGISEGKLPSAPAQHSAE